MTRTKVSAIMGYKYSNGKIGFPVESLGKVTSRLEEKKVDYVVIEDNEEKESMKYSPNNYNLYLELGEKKVSRLLTEEELLKKIDNLDEAKLDKIIDFIKKVINE